MAGPTDVKQLLLQVDASVELLRRNLNAGAARVDQFAATSQRSLDRVDRRFGTLGQPLAQLGTSIAATRRDVATLGASFEQTEARVRRSTASMKSALLASTAGLAAAFSVNEVKDYADSYTRYTNQLKLAGLEGQALTKTREALFAIAQRDGTQLESMGTLYGRAAGSAKELGASQSDLTRFTSGVSAALRIQGTSGEAASGALLQLGQLLGSARVQAEEFNSVNEGARPILQAVADNIEAAGGSVSKLKGLVTEGKVSNVDFFQAFLKGTDAIEAKASKANLTIGASLTILNNALGKYIGESDEGLSATARFSAGIKGIADNLDTILPALTAVAIGFGVTKAAGLGLDAVTAVLARVAQADAEVARQVLLGNASFIDRTASAARSAIAAEAAAAAEVTAIEATVAARRADQAAIAETLALIEAQRLESQKAAAQQVFNAKLNFGLGAAVTSSDAGRVNQDFRAQLATKRALAVADAELVIAEQELAAAQARSAAAATAANTATAATTTGARAAAAASALFSGALTLVATALPIVAIAALVGAIMHFRAEAEKAASDVQAFEQHGKELDSSLKVLDTSARRAAGGIATVGKEAASQTGRMLSFAGAVGEAAQKLLDLAKARRHEQVLDFTTQKVAADQDAANAQARINARQFSAKGERFSSDYAADDRDRKIIATANARSSQAYQAAQRAAAIPLDTRLSESERNGGRDVTGDLARSRKDLKVAQAGGDKVEVNRLKAEIYELTQYQAYRKSGASDESARARASTDAQRLRDAGQSKIDAGDAKTARSAKTKAEREAAAAAKKSAAAVVDEANDTRAFKAAERQANDQIAASHAELTNSAAERAQIERDRIEADRRSKNEELEQQLKAGRFTAARVIALQALNDQAAKAATDVVDQRELQRANQQALDLADRQSEIRREELTEQGQLATTAAKRREIELRLLALAKEDEKRRLAFILDPKNGRSESERAVAQLDLNTIDERYGVKGAAILSQTQSPLEQYREQLRATTDDMGDAIEGAAVRGFGALEDAGASATASAVTDLLGLKGVAADVVGSVISDLARLAIQKAIVSAIGGSLFGFADGGSLSGIPGRASGGSLGGLIRGPGTGRSDSILALLRGPGGGAVRLSNREFIMNEGAVDYYGADAMSALNSKQFPKFANGGSLSGRMSASALRAPRLPDLRPSGRRDQIRLEGDIKVSPTAEFDARMTSLSYQIVGASAEPIMAGATTRTLQRMARPGLPGGYE